MYIIFCQKKKNPNKRWEIIMSVILKHSMFWILSCYYIYTNNKSTYKAGLSMLKTVLLH